MSYHALFLSPMVPSFDLEVTGRFFESVLGFELIFESPSYRILGNNNLTVHLLPAGEDIGQMEFYLEVDDIEAVWASIRDKLKGITHREPFDQPYRMREAHVAVPATNTLLFIGQSIS